MENILPIGIDVGSTTVKAVVMDNDGSILWKKYQRHNTKQTHLLRDFLNVIEAEFHGNGFKIYITGSAGRAVAPFLNAQYIQEVNAVTYAVEKQYPDTGAVVELGGQDAKVIIWKEDGQGNRSTHSFMNDKCAGGTGATIDKIFNKIGITPHEAKHIRAKGRIVHHVAAKCGVFAETDVVGLLKSGTNRKDIVVSLCTAIVKQNLEVLVRGNVLHDKVLLLGGPHTFLPVFADIWREQIPATWDLHGWKPADLPLDQLIFVPDDSQYFAAIGAVLFGTESEMLLAERKDNTLNTENIYPGIEQLEHYITEGRMSQLLSSGAVRNGLASSEEEIRIFAEHYTIPPFEQPLLPRGTVVDAWLGIDGGSTSSKLVVLDNKGGLIYQDYILSQGNPIRDLCEIFGRMLEWERDRELTLSIKGSAVTGYAADILKAAFSFDAVIVETVAHMRSAVTCYGDIDVICDVGGQDIKVLFMKHGRVVDFKLNTQCSAGNGYFLQAMADQFDLPIDQYAARAFNAVKAPAFNYGCAVFMEQDRVNFQQLGWTNEEIMAGLALVLPLNIWNYVVQEPHIARFGKRFVLQGGTQKNLAAVKAQVDYIKSRVPGAVIHVHRHADVCGAMGAAIEIKEQMDGRPGNFIGIEQAARLSYKTTNDNSTRCNFCGNQCKRTFIDIRVHGRPDVRFISGNACDKGMAENTGQMRDGEKKKEELRRRFPNLVHQACIDVFAEYDFNPLPADTALVNEFYYESAGMPKFKPGQIRRFIRSSEQAQRQRQGMAVGIPRLLNQYLYNPFFSTYLRTLGVGKIVYSDYTSAKLWEEGNKWGAIDPCFPAKVAPAHIYNLLEKPELTHLCFPRVTLIQSTVDNTLANTACVIQMGTPEVVEAAFTKDRDVFRERGVTYWKPLVGLDNPLEACGMLFDYFGDRLDITRDENVWAVRQGYAAMDCYLECLRNKGAAIINDLIENDKIGILAIGHPYHHDPGLNHGILEEFQLRGFPIFCIESLPVSEEFLRPLFGNELEQELMASGYDVRDVWQRNFNRNTNHKIWAAKVAARHPNLAAVDFSSFKCGHDAPTYSYIDNILDASGTAHFLFHDLDQNKPRASFKIRILTIEYFLRHEQEKLRSKAAA